MSRFINQSENGRDLHSSIHFRCFLYFTSSASSGVVPPDAKIVKKVLSKIGAIKGLHGIKAEGDPLKRDWVDWRDRGWRSCRINRGSN